MKRRYVDGICPFLCLLEGMLSAVKQFPVEPQVISPSITFDL